MPYRGNNYSIAIGAMDDPIHYRPRPCLAASDNSESGISAIVLPVARKDIKELYTCTIVHVDLLIAFYSY